MTARQGRLSYVLWQTHQALRAALYAGLQELDLTPPQYAALALLVGEPGISSAEMARRASVTAQTMQTIVVGLEGRGLVERNEGYGRSLSVWPTEAGVVVMRAADRVVRDAEDRATQDLTSTEHFHMIDLLWRVRASISREPGGDPKAHGAPRRGGSGEPRHGASSSAVADPWGR